MSDINIEPAHSYLRTSYGGQTVNDRTRRMLETAAEYYGAPFTLTQGSYNAGGVSASAGTHDGGGVVDIDTSGMSDVGKAVRCLRQAGFAAQPRGPADGFEYHIHANAIGDREMAPVARDQVDSYFRGRNGLYNDGPDPSSQGRPFPPWAARYANGHSWSGTRAKTVVRPWVWADFARNPKHVNSIRIVQTAIRKEFVGKATPPPGPVTLRWTYGWMLFYKKWQESLYGAGPSADGAPGPDSLLRFAKKYGFEVRGTFPKAPATYPDNIDGWIAEAMDITGVPEYWRLGLKTIAFRESSYDPKAVNNWDSNATAGHPSKGLMQTIDDTFNECHQAGTSWNIFDPVANICAAINYIKRDYGDISRVHQADPNHDPEGY